MTFPIKLDPTKTLGNRTNGAPMIGSVKPGITKPR